MVRLRSSHAISAAVLAGEGTDMERDYDWASVVHGEDLPDPAEIGRTAGENAVKRLNPKKISSAQVPVVYDPRVSQSILAHLAGAVNGASIARGTSFLKDRMDTAVFSDAITIVDDPLRPRGLRSKAFDGEGLAAQFAPGTMVRHAQFGTGIIESFTPRAGAHSVTVRFKALGRKTLVLEYARLQRVEF